MDDILSILATGGTGGGTKWRDIFKKSGGTNVGSSAYKSLKGEKYPFCCFFCRKLTLAEQRFCAVTPYYI